MTTLDILLEARRVLFLFEENPRATIADKALIAPTLDLLETEIEIRLNNQNEDE